MLANNIQLDKEARAWLKRKMGPDEIVRIVPAIEEYKRIAAFYLYTAFDEQPDFLGSILFDTEGYWIYDGEMLNVTEQEQLANFIINYRERL